MIIYFMLIRNVNEITAAFTMQRRTIFNVVAITIMFVFATVFSASIIYAQQSSSPPAGSSLSSTTISPELKAKMCDPSNPSLKVVNTTESTICSIPKTVKPPSLSTAIPPTSVVSSTTQQTTKSTTVPVNNPSSRSLSSSTIAPQVNAINQQSRQQTHQPVTISNGTAGQNSTFASISPVATSGKLMYLGYHGANDDSSSKHMGSSDTKKSSSRHISNTNSDSSSRDKASSDIKHIKSTRDSDTHKHDSTRKKLNWSGDNLEGILKGIL
jgi:hypothetical protein